MLNTKEKNILRNIEKSVLCRNIKFNIKFNIKCNLQTTFFTIVFSLFFIFSKSITLTLQSKISISLLIVLFVYLFGSWHSFRNIKLATKLTIIYIKIKLKKLVNNLSSS